uniref:RHS repeat-associated core domain-containing protein n=1 Tax=Burkholderia anthina TaxID=179879 RepID=UPI00158EAED1|nr:RHS repeat-associated core domain-containing protein [Burkholderia anthina]
MGLLAVKHLDPVVGIDVHSVLVAPSPTPVFLPHPHVGFMLDLREYVEAAKGVVGSIAMALVQEKVSAYLEDHPDVEKKLGEAAAFASGKLADVQDNAIVAEGMKLEQQAAAFQSSIGNAIGAGAGMGGAAGRPIFVNGLMRATVGTHSFHVPGLHFPLGESFAPPPEPDPIPSDDAESFMGSRTVLANNDPMSFMALPALSCWAVGMEPPGHNSAHTERTYPSMPSSVMLPIPAGRPVMVGGPPVLNMAAAAKGLFKAFQGSKWAKALADKLNLKSGFLRCKVLKAEPVDVTTGEVVVQQNDFTVSGRLPLVWDRYYASHDRRAGAVGFGWQTPADIRVELMRNEGRIGAVAHFPDHATTFDDVPAKDGWPARTYDWQHGHALYCDDRRMVLRTREGIEYGFVLPSSWRDVVLALDGDSRLTLPVDRMVDLNGNAWVFERDVYGGLVRLVEWTRDGPTERLVECGMGRGPHAGLLTSLTLIDAGGNAHPLVSYEHDREGNLAAAIDAMAHPHHFEYASGHRMVSHTSARGVSFYYSYLSGNDGVWRVDHAWGDNGLFDYRFVYDRARMETHVTNSLGHTTITQMNEHGIPVAEIDPLGGVTSYRYDEQRRTNAETDPGGRTSSWKYDRYGNLLVQMLPDGSSVLTEYNVDHRPVRITGTGGRQWQYEWDAQGNLLALKTPTLATTRYTYDESGLLISYTGPRGAVTLVECNRDGHLAVLADALGQRTQYTHDALGNLIRVVDALGQVSSYEYDRNGNLVRAIEPGGREIHCAYDADGNLVRYHDPGGYVTQIEYSALGRISMRKMPDGSVVEYRYDTEEQLVGVVNERGELYQLKRDSLGRIVTEVDFWGQSRRYEYAPNGELQRSIDPLGRAILYRTDILGRIAEKQVPDPRQPDGFRVETFEYDACGNLVVAENPDSRVELVYDADGRVVEERQGKDFVVRFAYDAAGNQIERHTRLLAQGRPVEHRIGYDYDALDDVTSIQIDEAAPVMLERDAIGKVRVEHLGKHLRLESSYGADGRLAIQALLSNAGPLFTSEYTYDANGELLATRDSRLGVERFEYDSVGRLIQHIDPIGNLHRFLSDSAGNLLKTFDRSSRETGAFSQEQDDSIWTREHEYGDCRYTFDRSGNLVRKQDDEQHLLLYWDGDGLLVETAVKRLTEDGMSDVRTHYAYDAFHRRVSKVSLERSEAAPSCRRTDSTPRSCSSRFFWDGDALVGEAVLGEGDSSESADARRACDREWIYHPGTFRPLAVVHCSHSTDVSALLDCSGSATPERACHEDSARTETSHSRLYFFYNGQNGAPTRVVDKSGKIVWESNYTAWGKDNWTGVQRILDQPLRLQGQYCDQQTGLHYNRYRYYDSEIGIFISADPLGMSAGINLYQYAPNLTRWVDPFGLEICRLSAEDLKKMGPHPPSMYLPHRHHIVREKAPKSWKKKNRGYIYHAQNILARHGIDLNTDPRNFTWAPNEHHSVESAKRVAEILAAADKEGTDSVELALSMIGEEMRRGVFHV